MAYDDWDEGFRDVWDDIPGISHAEDWEVSHLEALYEAGFTHSADEYDEFGLNADEVYAIREEFFEFLGLDEGDFPWDEWREAMGYE